MSLHDYRQSKKLAQEDPPFYSLIMAAMRKADSKNMSKLIFAWPEVWNEFYDRYHAPGGYLPGEGPIQEEQK